MFPLPRIVYAMANDGLLPRCLGSVHSYFKTPLLATLLAGTFIPSSIQYLDPFISILKLFDLL